MNLDVSIRAMGAFMSRLGPRAQHSVGIATADSVVARGNVHSTRVFSDFVAALRVRSAPVVVDLGPVVGANVAFLGEQLACKLLIEDLLDKLPPPADGANDDGSLPPLSHQDGSVDGILCWDIFDYLGPRASRALAADLVRMLRPSGVVLLCYGTKNLPDPRRIKYEIVDQENLRCKFSDDVVPRPRRDLRGREVGSIFGPLIIASSVLLKSQVREVLLRKPSGAADGH